MLVYDSVILFPKKSSFGAILVRELGLPAESIGGRRTTYEAFVRTSAIIVQGSPDDDDDDDDTRKMPDRLPARTCGHFRRAANGATNRRSGEGMA